ncbi:MAG TPA: peptidoglycan DD-metalloendopeptidase family protein [Oligoflexia bacterium]|nr:peptidoglycan DD-metalloendopeptidase family protein [Oligoflexia bacterium]HMP47124.1 peptidoglycan DD-metalloendopeptidase family protein [Oligoflexia bacterium]
MHKSELEKILFKCRSELHSIIPFDFNKSGIHIDLSIDNKELEYIDPDTSEGWEDYIWAYMSKNNALVCAGGYREERSRYVRSSAYHTDNGPRIMHMGMDIWAVSGTPLFSPLDAVIHSFKDNANYLDYGPTIILEHELAGIKFHTLYGHLSRESLEGKQKGQKVKGGDIFSHLGTTEVNGNWPPHLHFQLILDMKNMEGDFPGLCTKFDLEDFSENCPDPNLLLDFKF